MSVTPEFPDRIEAAPYAFPLNRPISVETTALVVIDVQGDFCAEGGYMAGFGFDLTALRKPIPNIQALLSAARAKGITVVHTRETFAADLSDVQPHRLWRGIDGRGVAVGDEGPNGRYLINGEPCWDIIDEVAPLPGEVIFDKPSYGAFSTTDIDAYLREKGIRDLIFAGLTTDCCIHTTVREALDHGYDTLTVSDATAAGTEDVHEAALRLLVKKSGVFGAVADTAAVLAALKYR
jgi:nicotinamidase-related amidase